MNTPQKAGNRRILIIDDNRAIHSDFGKILRVADAENPALAAMEDTLFGKAPPAPASQFELASAFQGREGFDLVKRAEHDGHPFAVAFVDVRMPPGWDGVETIRQIWQISQNLQTVICTAFSDYSWEQIVGMLGKRDNLFLIRKPFDPTAVRQLAFRLSERWNAQQAA